MDTPQKTGYQLIFDALRNKKTDEGIVYAILSSNQLVEVTIVANTIISLRARGLTPEEAIQLLASDKVVKVNLEPFKAGMEPAASPDTICRIFSFSAPFALRHDRSSPKTLLTMLKIMERLASQGRTEKSAKAFQLMLSGMRNAFPELAVSRAAVQKRLADFESENMLGLPGINAENIPSDPAQIIDWAFSRVTTNDRLMESSILFYIFWGRYIKPIYKMIIRKSSTETMGSETAPGTAVVFEQGGVDIKGTGSVLIFREVNRIGELEAEEVKARRQMLGESMLALDTSQAGDPVIGVNLYLHQQDIRRFGLRDGEKVHAIFH
jgi:hypothetical protein